MFTALYGEEKRDEGVRGDPNEMRWNQSESGLSSNVFLMCIPQLDHSELFTKLYGKEKKEEGDRGGQEDIRGE